MFKVLETILEDLTAAKKYERYTEVQQYVIEKKLKDLVRIDSERTRIFIESHSNSDDDGGGGGADSAIEKLSAFPDLQLKLLDKIVKNKREKGQAISSHLLALHIDLISTFFPQKVVTELRQFDYPLDDALRIC